ncbi:MAG: hypothetical protein RRX95_00925 [Oscillospiraceae bacterium]
MNARQVPLFHTALNRLSADRKLVLGKYRSSIPPLHTAVNRLSADKKVDY